MSGTPSSLPTPVPVAGLAAGGTMGSGRPVGFNCPSCGVVLVIHDPAAYDGEPAPCPHCAVLVLPPRVCLPSADFIDLHPLPGLSGRGSLRSKTPRPIHRIDRHAALMSPRRAPGVMLSGSE